MRVNGNIPKDEAIVALQEALENSNNFNKDEVTDIIKMVTEIVRQNYFEWQGKTYEDPNGLPMGGPLSALLAEIYLIAFEKNKILNDNIIPPKIEFYCRYVDDILMALKCTKRQAKLLLSNLNKVHDKIKFKLETEENKIINFLDIKIIRNENKLEFGVYRKPTQTDLVIPRESNHPMSYKLSAFRSMAHRLLTYNLSTQEFLKEKRIIRQIAYNNGYDLDVIDNIIRKTKAKLLNSVEKPINKFVPMGYISKLSENMGHILRKAEYYPGYKVRKPHLFDTSRQQIDKENSSGVYMVECDKNAGCELKYVGVTSRTFKDRYREHTARNHKNPTSIVAQHLKQNPSHNIDFNTSMHILKKCNDKRKAKVFEEYYIYKSSEVYGRNNMLNRKEDFQDRKTYKLYHELDKGTRD